MRFQILSLSGGGYLGLYSAAVLADLEAQTGRRVVDMFDLLAGTSIGGIVALGLAAGASAASIRDAFVEDGSLIFGPSQPKRGASKHIETLRTLASSRYSVAPLRRTIERIVGKETTMAGLLRPTVIPAVNLTKGGPKVFKTGHHSALVLDWLLPVVDVALATSAAPTYFPAHRIGAEIFADGGLFANSPDMVAVHEAEQFLGVDPGDVHVLSVGTTSTSFAFSGATAADMGILAWMKDERLTSAIIGSQQAVTDDMMRHRLGRRYVRIDRMQADAQRGELALDCASEGAKKTLVAMAQASIAEASGETPLRKMLQHAAIDRPFVNASLGDRA